MTKSLLIQNIDLLFFFQFNSTFRTECLAMKLDISLTMDFIKLYVHSDSYKAVLLLNCIRLGSIFMQNGIEHGKIQPLQCRMVNLFLYREI